MVKRVCYHPLHRTCDILSQWEIFRNQWEISINFLYSCQTSLLWKHYISRSTNFGRFRCSAIKTIKNLCRQKYIKKLRKMYMHTLTWNPQIQGPTKMSFFGKPQHFMDKKRMISQYHLLSCRKYLFISMLYLPDKSLYL